MKKVFVATMITAMLVLSAALAGAATVTLGTISGGSGTAASNSSSYSFSGAFAFDTADLGGGISWQSIFGAQPFTFIANSTGTVPAYDYNGFTAGSIFKGNKNWIIDNDFPSPGDARFYGSIGSFTFDGSGNVSGTLNTDGFIHWYYGYDADLGPPPGMTSLASWNLDDTLIFSGTYTITGGTAENPTFSLNGIVTATVPEPGTLILLGSGLLGLVVAGRKKFRK